MVILEVFDSKPIGKGAFSVVYKGTYDSEFVAVKRLNFREDGEYFNEADVLSHLRHANIVKYYGIFHNDEDTYDIVLELGCGVTLAGALYREDLTTAWKRSTIHQISSGLTYMHARGVLHLDLKPPNIMFKDRNLERVLIGDFGMATVDCEAHRAGARKFRAPDSVFTQKSDVYSLASIACCILAGRNSESREETREIVAQILEQEKRKGSSVWYLALERGVHKKQTRRPTASQFRDAFEPPRIVPPPVRPVRVPPAPVLRDRNIPQSAPARATLQWNSQSVDYEYGRRLVANRPIEESPSDEFWWVPAAVVIVGLVLLLRVAISS